MNTSFTKKLVSEFLIRTPHPLSTILALSCFQQVASPTEQRLGEYGCALVGQSPLGTGLPTRQRLGPSPPLAPSRFTDTTFRPRLPSARSGLPAKLPPNATAIKKGPLVLCSSKIVSAKFFASFEMCPEADATAAQTLSPI